MKHTIYIASDHGGLDLKTHIIHAQALLEEALFIDLGPFSDESVDYPDYADALCKKVLETNALGILICGTGIGISIRANRHPKIRAALVCSDLMAEMTKLHNNANVLCLGGRTTSPEDAQRYIQIWLTTQFEGGRHQRRLDKLDSPVS